MDCLEVLLTSKQLSEFNLWELRSYHILQELSSCLEFLLNPRCHGTCVLRERVGVAFRFLNRLLGASDSSFTSNVRRLSPLLETSKYIPMDIREACAPYIDGLIIALNVVLVDGIVGPDAPACALILVPRIRKLYQKLPSNNNYFFKHVSFFGTVEHSLRARLESLGAHTISVDMTNRKFVVMMREGLPVPDDTSFDDSGVDVSRHFEFEAFQESDGERLSAKHCLHGDCQAFDGTLLNSI